MGANHLSNGNGVSVESYPEWELSASHLGLAVKELMEFYRDLTVRLKVSPVFVLSPPHLEKKRTKSQLQI